MPLLANRVPLSPVPFLRRAAEIFPEKIGVVDADGTPVTYEALAGDADRMADALRFNEVVTGERVGVLSLNNRWLLAAHFGVCGAGAALLAMNTRLSPDEYHYILRHSEVRILFVDRDLIDRLGVRTARDLPVQSVVLLPGAQTETLEGSADYRNWSITPSTGGVLAPTDEDAVIAVNYTSGTTARPKGVVYTHRGALLNSLSVALEFQLAPDSTYLWTLPMFHCNGWCFTWAVTAVGATHVCLSTFDAGRALELVEEHGVTHFCGAPVVLSSMARHDSISGRHLSPPVRAAVGGAPPAPATVSALQQCGISVTHLYGLTETYGPSLLSERQPEWNLLDDQQLAQRLARQGVRTVVVDAVGVVDDRLDEVPHDGETMGEIVVRSNTVMRGYLGDDEATDKALAGGWFHTGDLAVVHSDGYIEIRDRSKDIIVSGGENISSVEVEAVLSEYPGVLEVAVVAISDEHWGERPIAYVSRVDATVVEQDLIRHVRARLARFKAPDRVIFQDLPKTSTGKIRKELLREQARQRRGS